MPEKESKIIFPTSSAKDFSKKLSQVSQIRLGKIFIKKFPCQEKYIRLIDEVKEKTLYICALFSKNVDEILMEIFLIANAAKLAQAKKINLILPYLFYSRQDKKTEKNFREPISAKLLADLFKKAGIKKIITVHLHSQRIFKFYQGIELLNIETHQIFAKKLKKIIKNFSNFCIVAPDKGALNDCKKLSSLLGNLDVFFFEKKREEFKKKRKVKILKFQGNVKGKNIILFDDIIDTGETVVEAKKKLDKMGAKKVFLCATHPLFSKNALQKLKKAEFSKIIVSDSIPFKKKFKEIEIISLINVIAKYL